MSNSLRRRKIKAQRRIEANEKKAKILALMAETHKRGINAYLERKLKENAANPEAQVKWRTWAEAQLKKPFKTPLSKSARLAKKREKKRRFKEEFGFNMGSEDFDD